MKLYVERARIEHDGPVTEDDVGDLCAILNYVATRLDDDTTIDQVIDVVNLPCEDSIKCYGSDTDVWSWSNGTSDHDNLPDAVLVTGSTPWKPFDVVYANDEEQGDLSGWPWNQFVVKTRHEQAS